MICTSTWKTRRSHQGNGYEVFQK